MNTDMLANAMIFADTLNQQNDQFMLNVVYPEAMREQSLPSFLQGNNLENYYIPERWYSNPPNIPLKSFQEDTKPIKSFELIDGRNAKSYAMCVVGDYDEKTIILALSLGFPNFQQTHKIRELLHEILEQNTIKKKCYLAIYGGVSSEALKEIVRDWKCVKDDNRGALLYLRTHN